MGFVERINEDFILIKRELSYISNFFDDRQKLLGNMVKSKNVGQLKSFAVALLEKTQDSFNYWKKINGYFNNIYKILKLNKNKYWLGKNQSDMLTKICEIFFIYFERVKRPLKKQIKKLGFLSDPQGSFFGFFSPKLSSDLHKIKFIRINKEYKKYVKLIEKEFDCYQKQFKTLKMNSKKIKAVFPKLNYEHKKESRVRLGSVFANAIPLPMVGTTTMILVNVLYNKINKLTKNYKELELLYT
jgi:hypothetical protein